MPQKGAIAAFLTKYSSTVGLEYTVTQVPDEINRTTPDIDAFAEAAGGPPLAIEHTLIQTLQGQKQDNANFMEIFVPLSERLAPELPSDLQVIVGHGVLERGMKWKTIAQALEKWVVANAEGFPRGYSAYPDIEGVPFEVAVLNTGGLDLPFHISRMGPEKEQRQHETTEMIRVALRKKHGKLSDYAGGESQVILFLESEDWVLTSPLDLYDAYNVARSDVSAPDIDQVWLARFYREEEPFSVYCFEGPQGTMDAVNPLGLLWKSRRVRDSVVT